MVCKRDNWVCNICVYFGDVRQFSSSQKYVQKQTHQNLMLHAVRRIEPQKEKDLKPLKLILWAWKFELRSYTRPSPLDQVEDMVIDYCGSLWPCRCKSWTNHNRHLYPPWFDQDKSQSNFSKLALSHCHQTHVQDDWYLRFCYEQNQLQTSHKQYSFSG